MEIYILRDGKEIGPFSEEATQTMLKQGSIVINDLAWQPGMPQWIPLHNVLYPPVPTALPSARPPPPPGTLSSGAPIATENNGYSASTAAIEPESLTAVVNEAPPTIAEPATAKQKAFLSFMGIPFASDINRERAALLVNDALETPADPGRLARWNDERLRLHPELFRAEIQAKKENRASHFFDVAHMQGADVFNGVTKAHCQVLVGFLDVRYPNWDANEQHATWDYFFPAIAEKFPQLVKKEWKGKLKYPAGPKVAPELARRATVHARPRRSFPVGAIVRGIITGLAVLVLIYFGYNYWQTRKGAGATSSGVSGRQQSEQTDGSKASPTAGTTSDGSTAGLEKLLSQMPPGAASSTKSASDGSADASGTPAQSTTTSDPARMSDSSLAAGTNNSAPGNGSAPLFDPNATTNSTSLAPSPIGDATASPQPRTTLIVTKPTEVALKFGRVKLTPGTVVRFVGQEGSLVRIRYGTEIVSIPAASTDVNDLPAAPPAVPGPLPGTAAPPAPAPTPTPVTPPPATTPPSPPPSLF